MRIGIEVQNMFKKRKHATDITTIELLKQLQQSGNAHEFILYAQPDEEKSCIKMKPNMHVNISGPASVYVWEQEMLPQAIRYHNIDVLHCTNNTAPSALKMPLVVTIHDVIHLEKSMVRYGSWYQRFENLYIQWNMPRIAKTADAIITVSDYERQRLIDRLHIMPEKVKTVYHAYAPHFNAERNAEKLESFRVRHKLPEQFIFALGNLSPEKNLLTVLKALHKLEQDRLLDRQVVIADLNKTVLKKILDHEGMQSLEPYLVPTSYIPNKDLPNVYKLASVFLYPTLHESFGIPILEAMACGTPVITGNRPGNMEIAGTAAYYVDPSSAEELATGIFRVLKDTALRDQLMENGIKNAARFTWQRTAEQIISIYEALGT